MLFAVLTQSIAAMIAVVAARVVVCDRSTVTGVTPPFDRRRAAYFRRRGNRMLLSRLELLLVDVWPAVLS